MESTINTNINTNLEQILTDHPNLIAEIFGAKEKEAFTSRCKEMGFKVYNGRVYCGGGWNAVSGAATASLNTLTREIALQSNRWNTPQEIVELKKDTMTYITTLAKENGIDLSATPVEYKLNASTLYPDKIVLRDFAYYYKGEGETWKDTIKRCATPAAYYIYAHSTSGKTTWKKFLTWYATK